MDQKNRVLAYNQAMELDLHDLIIVSGGTGKFTLEHTQKITGRYPGNLDAEADQVWD